MSSPVVFSFGGENFTQGTTALVLIAPHTRPIRRQAGPGRSKARQQLRRSAWLAPDHKQHTTVALGKRANGRSVVA